MTTLQLFIAAETWQKILYLLIQKNSSSTGKQKGSNIALIQACNDCCSTIHSNLFSYHVKPATPFHGQFLITDRMTCVCCEVWHSWTSQTWWNVALLLTARPSKQFCIQIILLCNSSYWQPLPQAKISHKANVHFNKVC